LWPHCTELRVEIKKLHQQLGSTMIYVTPDQIEAMTLADRIAVMNKGVIQQFAAPKEVYTRPANRFVAGFVGSPSMNFIKATVMDPQAQVVRTTEGREISLKGYTNGRSWAAGQKIEIDVHPDQWSLAARRQGAETLEAQVTVVENTGAEGLIWAKADDTTVAVKVPDEGGYSVGQKLQLCFLASQISAFEAETGERI